jgi:translation initiation factor IF-2
MAEAKKIRLNRVLKEFNISLDRAVEYLGEKGYEIEARPTTKITDEVYQVLSDQFETDKSNKVASKEISEEKKKEKEEIRLLKEKELQKKEELKRQKEEQLKQKEKEKQEKERERQEKEKQEAKQKQEAKEKQKAKKEKELKGPKQVGKIDLGQNKKKPADKSPKSNEKKESKKPVKTQKPEEKETPQADTKLQKSNSKNTDELVKTEKHSTQYEKLKGPNFTGEKIDLGKYNEDKKKKEKEKKEKKERKERPKRRRRKRISKDNQPQKKSPRNKGRTKKQTPKEELTPEEIQKQVRETLEKLEGKSNKKKGARYRKDKREQHKQKSQEELEQQEKESKKLKVTEFVTVSEVASLMDVSPNEVISACMSLGMMVTMNQRLDAETLSLVVEEFGYEVEIATDTEEEIVEEDPDNPEDLEPRAPIVTVMGHVDHGKTSLLDYIRKANVIAGESGGITQHIAAYAVELPDDQKIAFLDTPGHEAFTAMRARGAQVTDIAIIVIAADDDVKPQTKEAISHAQAAGVPIVFAINKIDLPNSDVEKVKQTLAGMDLLVEDFGGKIQSQDISAKKGDGIDDLLEKVLLESEILDLQANPNKKASGTVVEAYLDKGRGYVSTVLVQGGTLKVGDFVLAGTTCGKVKALHDERGNDINDVSPSTPVSVLGLDGAPQAGDHFKVMEDEREAKEIATKRAQLQREQNVRTQKHITLDEIGRRIALGDFKELNVILKADVDGSVEALSDSLQKLSTEEIQVNIIHKGVGAITESDVLLASASDAVIIGFNVRPAGGAKQLSDKEEIDIRTYSIIYDAINDIRDAMEGMLSPEVKEEVTGTAEIRETFKISKIGTIAGCMITSGVVYRNSKVRIIRDGIVIKEASLDTLKRFKDDVKEVKKGYECGIQIKNFNDIKEGDIIEAYQEVEVKKKLK